MARVTKAGYSSKAVAAYINSLVERKEASRANGVEMKFLNGQRMTADDIRRVGRWANETDQAELAAVDRLLMRHDLALWEFEHWATEQFGDSTFFDTTTADVVQ